MRASNGKIRVDGRDIDAQQLRREISILPGFAERAIEALIGGTVAEQQIRELFEVAARLHIDKEELAKQTAELQQQTVALETRLQEIQSKRLRDQQRANNAQDALSFKLKALQTELEAPRQVLATAPRLTIENERGTRTPLTRSGSEDSDAPVRPRSKEPSRSKEPRRSKSTRRSAPPDPPSDPDSDQDEETVNAEKTSTRKVFPDPELLSDGKKVGFETWELRSVRNCAETQDSSRHERTKSDTSSPAPKDTLRSPS